MIKEPGIYQLTAEAYHADPVISPSLSNSIARILLTQSPRHAALAHPRINPDVRPEEDSRFDLGSAAHAMLMENDKSNIVFMPYDDWRKKEAQQARDTARALGQLPILAKYEGALHAMVREAHKAVNESELSGLFESGKPEQTVIWQSNDIWCRSRVDFLANDFSIILDYKTTDNANPAWFSRQVGNMSYDQQGCFYTRGVAATTHKTPLFVLLVQEITEPYACSLIGLSNAFIEIAQAKVERAMRLWSYCLTRNEWPGYPTQIAYAEPASWMLAEHERAMAFESDNWAK